MSAFDPRRDPPIFAVLLRTPPRGTNAGQFLDAGERLIGLAAAEPGFLGIEDLTDEAGVAYTVCYWDRPQALKRWRGDAQEKIPMQIDVDHLIVFEGCLWHWLTDVFDAVARARTETVVSFPGSSAVA